MSHPRALTLVWPLVLAVGALLLAYAEPVASRASGITPLRAPTPSAQAAAPSLYRLSASWQTDDERHVRLASLRGHFQVLALIFTRCPSVCPTLVRDLVRLQQQMPERVAAATRFTLVSIDPAHDTPPVLRAYRQQHGLSVARFTLLRGAPDDVRELGATLGFSFTAGGDALPAHSKLVTLLGPDGRILHQQTGIDGDADKIIQLIAAAL